MPSNKCTVALYCHFENASWYLNASETLYGRFEIASRQQNVSKTPTYRFESASCQQDIPKHNTIGSKPFVARFVSTKLIENSSLSLRKLFASTQRLEKKETVDSKGFVSTKHPENQLGDLPNTHKHTHIASGWNRLHGLAPGRPVAAGVRAFLGLVGVSLIGCRHRPSTHQLALACRPGRLFPPYAHIRNRWAQ